MASFNSDTAGKASKTDILVVGCGVGGCAAALALRRQGFSVRVCEAAASPRLSSGSVAGGVQIAPNGLRALELIGGQALLRRLLDYGVAAPHGFRFQTHHGDLIAQLQVVVDSVDEHEHEHEHEHEQHEPKKHSEESVIRWDRIGGVNIRRAAVVAVLLEALREQRDVEIEFGKRLVELVEGEDSVCARFGDGSSALASLVVAADGVHSTARGLILDAEYAKPRHTGFISFGGIASLPGVQLPSYYAKELVFTLGPRCQLGFGRFGPEPSSCSSSSSSSSCSPSSTSLSELDGEHVWMWWTHLRHDEELSREQLEALPLRARCELLVEDFTEPLRSAVLESSEILRTQIYDVPCLPVWHRGRTVLLGDAAHAMSSAGGQGCSMAFEDACVLARLLDGLKLDGDTDSEQLESALSRYSAVRKARVEPIIRQAQQNDARGYARDGDAAADGWLALKMKSLFLWMMSGFIARSLRKLVFADFV
eukprot:CAMPEP_0177646492 /NCGR_PEP_ID=MMETSP0447-20121125/9801_1 /TAXON_ID=0 /ORGANISM="Stygamoeba regulata, Strain BSH-02190019" /LENGTH=479 /DNA_ID=CAMNT_0019149025 /DNA_START=270 /DNA_END=1709 /DNA_ORIENTATION=+